MNYKLLSGGGKGKSGFGGGGGGTVTGAANVGGGSGWFRNAVAGILNFKSVIAGANVTIVPATDSITISATNAANFFNAIFANQLDFAGGDNASAVPALSTQDALNSGIAVRRFSNLATSGAIFSLVVPSGVTNMQLTILGRPLSAVGGNVSWQLATRAYVPNSPVQAWNSAPAVIQAVPANTNMQFFGASDTVANWHFFAGGYYQCEIMRNAPGGLDTLATPFDLHGLQLLWS